MNFKLSIILIVLGILISQHQCQKIENGIVELTDGNFYDMVNAYPSLVVYFFSPTCQHCNKFNPLYKELAAHYADNENIKFGRVNIMEQETITKNLNVNEFPTIFLFQKTTYSPYTDSRTIDVLKDWIDVKIADFNVEINTLGQIGQLQRQLQNNSITIYVGKSSDEQQFYAFNIIAQSLKGEIATGHTFNEEVAQGLGFEQSDLPTIFTIYQNNKIKYDQDDFTLEQLENFYSQILFPIVSNFNDSLRIQVFGKGQPSVFLIQKQFDEKSNLYQEFYKVALEHQGQLPEFINFSINQQEEHDVVRFNGKMGITEQDYPLLMAVIYDQNEDLEKYIYRIENADTIKESEILDFVQQYKKSNKDYLHIKSQPIVEFKKNQNIQQIVRDNYDENVLQSKQNTVVMFTAHWCEACDKLKQKMDKLAGQLEKAGNEINFFFIDAEKNDINNISFSNFPGVFLYKNQKDSGEKERILYDKSSDINSVYHFLKDNLSNLIEVQGYEAQSELEQKELDQQNKTEKIEL